MEMKHLTDEEKNEIFRESLRLKWQEVDFDQTDRGKKLPKPSTTKQYESGKIYDLDKDLSDISDKKLFEIVHSRRSTRKYQEGTMTKKEFSYLANLTCDIVKFGPGYAMGVVPTGGATSTLETYFYLHQVEGFEQGLYHYMKDTNQVRLIRSDITPEQVNDSIANQLRGAQLIMYWTTTPYRCEYKYTYLSHKMISMEAGHACQNLYLASEAIQYGTVAIAAYDQERADELLQVGEEEFVIYCAAVGKKII